MASLGLAPNWINKTNRIIQKTRMTPGASFAFCLVHPPQVATRSGAGADKSKAYRSTVRFLRQTASGYFSIASNSTSKINVALGPMAAPAPRSP